MTSVCRGRPTAAAMMTSYTPTSENIPLNVLMKPEVLVLSHNPEQCCPTTSAALGPGANVNIPALQHTPVGCRIQCVYTKA